MVDLDNVKISSRLAQAILSSDGTVLLGKGVSLTQKYIERLKKMGIFSVYIIDERFPDLQFNDVISENTRMESINNTRKLTEQIKKGITIESPKVFQTINCIMDDLLSQKEILINLADIRTYDSYTFAHSVNVCVLSLLIGSSLQYNQIKLRNLGIGALLHDLGKVHISSDLINKDCLTEAEITQLQEHCHKGFLLLQKQRDFSILSAHVAYQHHERYDGKGYPQGLQGENIHEFARIVAIADTYDNMRNKPNGKINLTHEIYEYLMASCYTLFDPLMITHFLRHLPPYPNGTIVLLNTKEKGIVVNQNIGCLIRPIVRIFEKNDQLVPVQFEYNLLDNPTILVEKVIG